MMKKLILMISGLLSVAACTAQIYLDNASFEGNPQDATVPVGWFPCELGTTPDVMPGPWGVYQEASEGDTYMGLITREDGTWESVGQRLKSPIKAKDCYYFTLDLSHADTYASYNETIKVRIWGSASKCGKDQLLFESKLITHTDWQTYKVQFTAKKDINYILIEAFYKEESFSRRGNVLIDNISAFKKCVRV